MAFETVNSWSGAPIATDDVGNSNYQIVKLDMGLPGASAPGALLVDAFGRMRVSDPVALFDSQFQYDLQPLLWEPVTTTGGVISHSTTLAAANVVVTNVSNASAMLQTYQYHRYQPGRSQLVAMTFNLQDQQTGATKRVGYFDDENGFFLEVTATGVAFGRRSNATGTPTDVLVEQAEWNVDPLTGSGLSGHRLDLAKTQILIINFQWLGVGACVMGFDIDGTFVPCHQWRHANNLTVPYMTTANLPLRYELTRTGTLTSASLLAICHVVMSEGGFSEDNALPFAAGTDATGIAVTTRRAVMSLRCRATLNGIASRGQIIPQSFDLGVSNGSIEYEIVYNPVFASTVTWTAVASNYSMAEWCSHATATSAAFTGGIVLGKGYLFVTAAGVGSRGNESGLLRSKLPISLDEAGNSEGILSIVITAVAGTPDVWASMNWLELR